MQTISQLMDLRGRRAMLTGALGGIGRVMAHTLAELGADLVLVDHPNSDGTALLAELQRWQVSVTLQSCDIEDAGQRRQLMDAISVNRRGLSILVNNAAFVGTSGLQGWAVPFEQQSVETFRRALEVNLTAIFDFCQGLAPVLGQSPGANIVNVGSIYGMLGPDWNLYEGTAMSNPAAYAASKGGLIQFTRWLATTLSPAVRVNSISPGGVWRNQPQSFVDRYEARTPLGRMANEQDFAGALAFLATDQARYVTGQNLAVDGGWSAW
ncbi:SDR family oxidoreductase [Laribacter hongkongensis]|uniref:SDR family oxidoreductase n=1 Tax=Laribacter hongkongensis TaxID=168471 RepID=UPI001EFC9C1E|nr:SDR family oxidoreductase [Laribacter hongkongensis]MCG8995489.1 SDR family oxidoreductase [Laribacter hongkongensis]MCG9010306.1 SDR family oxidoreductase [Laribacter hongkongensis]MCG9046200.1 SDR family oxidoreductase [Laribacter hongkongensis]MCG9051741.1 SDR family oxidoreductase [Laribacter hongkongensis]MCG9073772.1 SDR family oxidoreductase [Laribacter hongkongensis]